MLVFTSFIFGCRVKCFNSCIQCSMNYHFQKDACNLLFPWRCCVILGGWAGVRGLTCIIHIVNNWQPRRECLIIHVALKPLHSFLYY